jgi:hypothetical protein
MYFYASNHLFMKTNILIIFLGFLLLSFLPSTLMSQEGEVYVSINAGVSIPLLDYAESDFDNESSGFAKTGASLKIDFGYGLNDYLSLTGMFLGGVNRFDYIELRDWLTENFATTLPNTQWVVESKSWGLGGLLVGARGHLPLVTNTLFLEATAMGGFLYVYSPARYITGVTEGEEDITISTEQYASPSWALDGGLGLRYKRSRSQYFILSADYIISNPYYSGVETNSSIGLESADSFSQRVSTINIMLGLGYIID